MRRPLTEIRCERLIEMPASTVEERPTIRIGLAGVSPSSVSGATLPAGSVIVPPVVATRSSSAWNHFGLSAKVYSATARCCFGSVTRCAP